MSHRPLRLLSWNVNGIRSVCEKGFLQWLEREDADIVCLQETKARPEQLTHIEWPGEYERFWNSAEKPGYSGTGIFTKQAPLSVSYGIKHEAHDREGRVITAEYESFYLVNVYVPNSKRDLSRLDYRQGWDSDFLAYLKDLEQSKPVVWCGDLNVAHTEIDLARPKGNEKNHGFTPEERAGFDGFVNAGFIDTFREFEKSGGHYTWWSTMGGARARNIGWRIDYFLISPALRPALKEAFIQPDVRGSDHCPLGIVLEV
jgi:exodeoxyribonuclease-3